MSMERVIGVLVLCWSLQLQAASLDGIRQDLQERHYSKAESALKEILSENPKNDEARYLLARVLSWQGNYIQAYVEYQTLLTREPDNTDYLLGLAQVEFWRGNPSEAIPILERARNLNPKDSDLVRLNIQALAAIGDQTSYSKALKLQTEAIKQFPAQEWRIVEPIAVTQPELTMNDSGVPTKVQDALDRSFAKERNNQIGAGFSFDHLSKGKGVWRARYIEFEHRFAPRKIVYGSLQESDRFNLNDLQWILGGYYPLPADITLNVEANASASHNMIPRHSELASLQFPLGNAFFLTGGMKHSEYTASNSLQEFGMIEKYFSDYRIAYTLTATQSHGINEFGHRASLSRYYNEISYATLSLSSGTEVEQVTGKNYFYDTWFVGANGRHWINKDWALLWSIGRTVQDTAYTRTGASLGFRYAF